YRHIGAHARETRDGDASGAGVIGSCEPPNVGAENQTQVLWKNMPPEFSELSRYKLEVPPITLFLVIRHPMQHQVIAQNNVKVTRKYETETQSWNSDLQLFTEKPSLIHSISTALTSLSPERKIFLITGTYYKNGFLNLDIERIQKILPVRLCKGAGTVQHPPYRRPGSTSESSADYSQFNSCNGSICVCLVERTLYK
ncbi:hypothetical protein STEG23_008952, partial [Scotinomys teguina]